MDMQEIDALLASVRRAETELWEVRSRLQKLWAKAADLQGMPLDDRIKTVYASGGIVDAVKMYRQYNPGKDLLTCKQAVEKIVGR